jgi:hypothetical protein
MARFLRAVLIAAVLVRPSLAQTGTVIFYTDANSAKKITAGLLLPKSQQPFTGWLFDGSQRLAHVRPRRFIAFHLKTGTHSFTVPWHPSHPGKDALVINVEDGGQYCVHLYTKMTNFEVVPWAYIQSQIEEVPCQLAKQNAGHLNPIELKRIDPAVRGELDPSTTFPIVNQSQP